jgi:phosphotransferase system  glucose/maltose/N-acetylglucosamine-specific IIC component
MSKNVRRKQKKVISTPVFILMCGGALLLAAGIIFGLQSIGDDRGGGTPALGVDQEVIQYGDVKFNVPLTFAIKVTNTGNGMLRFKEEPYIEVREGC